MQASPETIYAPRRLKPRQILMLGNTHSGDFLSALKLEHNVVTVHLATPIPTQLRTPLSTADILLVDLTTVTSAELKILDQLNALIGISNLSPRLLCCSAVHRNPHFELAVEKYGARYVRVSNPAILLDAIDLVIAERDELQRNGPCFQVIHRFSQGGCAPGEEVSAILLAHGGRFFQLPLPLAQRLVFNLLAEHRRIALDSLQIVSALTADWFYRDHAANSGHRQVKKIRRPTVKVLVQRIREALASTFTEAKLKFDPCNVLCSCPAEGSKRVLYKLQAEIRWHHVDGENH
jgi:hypothetical protein